MNPWDRERRRTLTRISIWGEREKLDRAVNYFVLKLEEWGAITLASCGGHPYSFYVMFHAPIQIAERIARLGYFTVELTQQYRWAIRLTSHEHQEAYPWTYARKRALLRTVANVWEKQ